MEAVWTRLQRVVSGPLASGISVVDPHEAPGEAPCVIRPYLKPAVSKKCPYGGTTDLRAR